MFRNQKLAVLNWKSIRSSSLQRRSLSRTRCMDSFSTTMRDGRKSFRPSGNSITSKIVNSYKFHKTVRKIQQKREDSMRLSFLSERNPFEVACHVAWTPMAPKKHCSTRRSSMYGPIRPFSVSIQSPLENKFGAFSDKLEVTSDQHQARVSYMFPSIKK